MFNQGGDTAPNSNKFPRQRGGEHRTFQLRLSGQMFKLGWGHRTKFQNNWGGDTVYCRLHFQGQLFLGSLKFLGLSLFLGRSPFFGVVFIFGLNFIFGVVFIFGIIFIFWGKAQLSLPLFILFSYCSRYVGFVHLIYFNDLIDNLRIGGENTHPHRQRS